MEMRKYVSHIVLLTLGIQFVGCSYQASTPSTLDQTNPTSAPAVDTTKLLLTTEPAGASDVINVRESASDGDHVVITGRIGGGENPWIEGRAAFSLVDGSLKACSDIPGDQCKKPWDYCCVTDKIPTSTALVKIVDENGKLVKADARKLLGVKELSTVVIKGTAQRDDAGNLTVLANGVYVKK